MLTDQKRILLTTSNENTWEMDKPVLFLGKWCLNPNREHVWSKLNYEILESNFFSYEKDILNIKYCDELYEKILDELVKSLNNIHSINWSKRSWRIFIGPWLNRFVAVINNRLGLLIEAYEKEEFIFSNKLINPNNLSLASYDLRDFTDKSLHNEWNNLLFIRLNEIYTTKKFNNKNYLEISSNLNLEKNYKKSSFFNLVLQFTKNKIFLLMERLLCKKNKFLFYKPYFGNFLTTLKLIISLGEIPFKYFVDEKRIIKNLNLDLRQKLNINIEVLDYREKIIRSLIKECIPTLYIEGFKDIRIKSNKSFLPKKNKIIFTSNAWKDTAFKYWLADQVNGGAKLVYGQHGSAYGILLEHYAEKHELKICDKYLSWGWKDDDKVIPGPVLSVLEKKQFKKNEATRIIVATRIMHLYLYANNLLSANRGFESVKYYLRFLKLLNEKVKKDVCLKLHPAENRVNISYEPFIKKYYPNIKVLDINIPLLELIDNSKLTLFCYWESTQFLQCMALDRPCVVILEDGFEQKIRPSAKKIFQDLIKIKVLHLTPESAATFLNQNLDNIYQWWNHIDVKKTKENFCQKYASKNKNSLHDLKNIFKQIRVDLNK